MATINPSPSPDTPITIKIALSNGENRRFKLALRDLGAVTLPDKLRQLLAIPPTQDVLFERFSDSAGAYITLDSNNPSVYKQLYRAAKAKLKLRIKVTVADTPVRQFDMVQPELLSDRLTSHRYVVPMKPDPLQAGITAPPTAASANSGLVSHSTPAKARVDLLATKTQRLRHGYPTNIRNELVQKSQKCCFPTSLPPKASSDMTDETTADATKEAVKSAVDNEAAVPSFIPARENLYNELNELVNIAKERPNLLRSADQEFPVPSTTFTICCNNCDAAIPDAHWHCSICDEGDFDLCGDCVEKGVLCDTADHWLIKRFVQDGKVINSTTETMAPTKATNDESEKEVPGAFTSENKEPQLQETTEESRTCNSCVQVFNESNFVTCTVCDDYDLCIPCHVGLKHGHHPGHNLEPASKKTMLNTLATNLCAPGRNMRHFAFCDSCDKAIHGVRHKCMNCPDWDYCSTCVKSASVEHPGHRFVPLFEIVPNAPQRSQRHNGVYCDGPLCVDKGDPSCIVGDRYKCAVCHDTDFCANCEALPTNRHNRTHPLIKFKTPVKNVSVTTLGEKENGEQLYAMGDHLPQTSSKSTETTPAARSANAATQVQTIQVQTIAELKPTEPVKEEAKTEAVNVPAVSELQAIFVRDTIADGSVLAPGVQFEQVWTLRNPGPHAWPAGCSVRFIGGDAMFNVDSNHPSSTSDIVKATESNAIDRVVEVGEEVDFAVVMRTPEHEGKGISYWRLKAADGVPFGHKLWCDVTVRAPKPLRYSPVAMAEHIEDIAKHVTRKEIKDAKVKEEESQSQMIFPKLDKESPVSSTHEAETTPAPPAASAGAPATPAAEVKELLEDVESLGLDDDETDDGFFTDEEYEMLNTSDDEFMEALNGKK
ncbi:hypothetical protein MMC29_005298 [Sticta canariensis]|nr:hypothetical protein [Sticta canariensis]